MTMTIPHLDATLRERAQAAIAAPRQLEALSEPALARLRALGTELWLDTGDSEEARGLWRREFSAFTVNNTLANQVVQTGRLDAMVRKTASDLRNAGTALNDARRAMELGFVVNCQIALDLVQTFVGHVSVELHPSVADDTEGTIYWAERYYAVCPERFLIKIPLSPEGYCATARVQVSGIPVNFTLGFSARQNYLAALLARPKYVNVFLGRLNQVVSDNQLGDGKYVGEKATLASQQAVRSLRTAGRTATRQIAASMRTAAQMVDLAGVDVYTIPTRVAREFLAAPPSPEQVTLALDRDFAVEVNSGDFSDRLSVLWTLDEKLKEFAESLRRHDITELTGDDLRQADRDFGVGLFHRFDREEIAAIQAQGKIPDWSRWQNAPEVALDDLMTQSALQAFVTDQAALDDHLRTLL